MITQQDYNEEEDDVIISKFTNPWSIEIMERGKWKLHGTYHNVMATMYELERLNLPDSKVRVIDPDGSIF